MNSYLQSVVTNSVNIGYSQLHRGTAEGHISAFLPAVLLSNHPAQQTQQASQQAVQQSESMASTSATPRIKRSPINEFNLCDFGIDLGTLLQEIGPTFDSLVLDIYEKRRQEVVFLKSRFPEHLPVLNAFFLDYMSSKAKLSDLSDYARPMAPGALLKACIMCMSILNLETPLDQQLISLGGGLELHTKSDLPTGSGLGNNFFFFFFFRLQLLENIFNYCFILLLCCRYKQYSRSSHIRGNIIRFRNKVFSNVS